MAQFVPVEPFNLVIFGGTGDLTQRKLLPALFHRWMDGQISAKSRVIGTARNEMGLEEYVAFARDACRRATKDKGEWDRDQWDAFSKILGYQTLNALETGTDWDSLKTQITPANKVTVFYLATPPRIYENIAQGLARVGLNTPGTRVVLEKPIGKDLASAKAINDGVGAFFDENQIFRIDHYLGKETVQNLLVLRFANRLLEPSWNRSAIDHVQITVAEDLGLEGRAGYYDKSGALRDMVQNHLVQLLCLTAMEPPATLDGDDVRTEKLKVLKGLRAITPQTALYTTARAQYLSGSVDGEPARGYLEELDDGESETETFVAIKAEIDNWRWAGVPFYLRTGKRMAARRSEIAIIFKPVPHSLFGGETTHANKLIIRLQPDEAVRLFVQIKEPGPGGLRIQSLPLNLSYAENFFVRYPDAYERLLMDVVRGNLALFMRRDEVEAAWTWIDGILAAWEGSDAPMHPYAAGHDGPTASADLLKRDGRAWWSPKEST